MLTELSGRREGENQHRVVFAFSHGVPVEEARNLLRSPSHDVGATADCFGILDWRQFDVNTGGMALIFMEPKIGSVIRFR